MEMVCLHVSGEKVQILRDRRSGTYVPAGKVSEENRRTFEFFVILRGVCKVGRTRLPHVISIEDVQDAIFSRTNHESQTGEIDSGGGTQILIGPIVATIIQLWRAALIGKRREPVHGNQSRSARRPRSVFELGDGFGEVHRSVPASIASHHVDVPLIVGRGPLLSLPDSTAPAIRGGSPRGGFLERVHVEGNHPTVGCT